MKAIKMYLSQDHALTKTKCVKCGSHNLIEYFGNRIVCADCGFVNVQNASNHNKNGKVNYGWKSAKRHKTILEREEYRMENVTSSSVPFYLNKIGLQELIKELQVSDSIERNMALTLYEITETVFNLSLPEEVLIEATHIYEELAKKCSFKGKSLKVLSAAIVYLASKRAGFPCSMREVAHVTGVRCNKIFKYCEFILERLGEADFSGKKGEAYIRRVCNLLEIKDKTFEVANRIMQVISRGKYRNGKCLPGLVSASIYIASKLVGERVTHRQLAEATRVTEATIRTRYKDITKNFLFVLNV